MVAATVQANAELSTAAASPSELCPSPLSPPNLLSRRLGLNSAQVALARPSWGGILLLLVAAAPARLVASCPTRVTRQWDSCWRAGGHKMRHPCQNKL